MSRSTVSTVGTSSNGKAGTVPALAYVQVQTMRGNTGIAAVFAEVEKAVAAYNATMGKASKAAPHTAVQVPVLKNNVKGMQFHLALVATLCRMHGANMIRLNVHNGAVAICGPKDAVKRVQDAQVTYVNEYATMVANAYNPAVHGNKVGFGNAFLCGCPAGLQVAHSVQAQLAYGIGFLFTFPAPSNNAAYSLGQSAAFAAATTAAKPKVTTTKTATTIASRKPSVTRQNAPSAPVAANAATDATTTATDAPTAIETPTAALA